MSIFLLSMFTLYCSTCAFVTCLLIKRVHSHLDIDTIFLKLYPVPTFSLLVSTVQTVIKVTSTKVSIYIIHV